MVGLMYKVDDGLHELILAEQVERKLNISAFMQRTGRHYEPVAATDYRIPLLSNKAAVVINLSDKPESLETAINEVLQTMGKAPDRVIAENARGYEAFTRSTGLQLKRPFFGGGMKPISSR